MNIFWIILMLLIPVYALPQVPEQLTLNEIQSWAAQHFPLLRQKEFARKSADMTRSNQGNSFLPQINMAGQATWQNEVTQIPVNVPGMQFDPLSLDQYRFLVDINQLLYDGGQTKLQQKLTGIQADLRHQEVDINLHVLKERINRIFLTILLLDEQKKLQALVISDLDAGIGKVNAQIANGTAFRSHLALLQSEQLKAQQRINEIQIDREGLIDVLKLLTNKEIGPNAQLIAPDMALTGIEPLNINRPELEYYHLKDSLLLLQNSVADSKTKPRLSIFANSGYGRPGLNMLKNEFAPFVIAGLRIQWNLAGFYGIKKEKNINEIARLDIKAQQDNFVMQTRADMLKQNNDVAKYQSLLTTDDEIIQLKQQVKEAALAQLDQGIITATDYLREVHAEDAARQQKQLHRLQKLQAFINYQTLAGY